MKLCHPSILVLLLAAQSMGATEVVFGPVRAQSGQSVRVVTHAQTHNATLEITGAGNTGGGAIAVQRDRDITWTFREPTADGALRGMIHVAKMVSVSSVVLDGEEQKVTDVSPLSGQILAMTKPPGSDWKLEFKGAPPRQEIVHEMDELILYLKRKWYPGKTVKVGDSWEFDPAWIRSIVERDVPQTQTIGTMKLLQVRHRANKNIAVIGVSVRSAGGGLGAGEQGGMVRLELNGEMSVNLDTMLDESIDLKGQLVTGVASDGVSKKVTLPIGLVVTKMFLNNP